MERIAGTAPSLIPAGLLFHESVGRESKYNVYLL
jgi:hypothetical protein